MTGNSTNKFSVLKARLKSLGPMAPRFSFGLRLSSGVPGSNFFKLPFRRSLLFIMVSAGFLAAFSVPYFTMGEFFASPEDDSLFSLVFMLFGWFWILGWSVGVFILLAVFLLLSFGTEILQIRPGWVTLRFEVLRLGLNLDLRAEAVENVRWEAAVVEGEGKDSGHSWRGDHMALDYSGETIRFGSAVDQATAVHVGTRIQDLAVNQSPGISQTDQQQSESSEGRELNVAQVTGEKNGFSEHQAIQLKDNSGSGATSTRVLILANLIPLAGVLLDDWRIGEIMLLFWAESAIIGFFNVLKMWVIGRWSILFLGPFFIGHFGGFMVGHLLFIYGLFLSGPEGMDPSVNQVFADFIRLWPALIGLSLSHAVSFRLNFVNRKEYQSTTVKEQMGAPYKRIIIMHVTIIFGGFLTMAFDAPLLALLLLILLKISVDVKAHKAEHRNEARKS